MGEAFVFGGLIGLALVVALVGWFVKSASDVSRETKANTPQVLDDLFNGDEVVSYTSGFVGLDFDTVVKAGIERGYRLTAQTTSNRSYGMDKLVFTKQH